MAEQIIDKVQVEVEASAKGTSAVFEQLERRLTTLQNILNKIDTTNLEKVQQTAKSTNVNVNTDGITKAEKEVSKSVSKIQQALAGLQAYANAAMNGDSSSMTSFERRVISIQSSMDVLEQKFKQLGDVKIPTDAMAKLQVEMEKTESHLDSLEKKRQQMTDSGGNPKGGVTQEWIDLQTALSDAKNKYDELYAAQKKLTNEGNAWIYPLNPYKDQLSELQQQLNATADAVRTAYSEMNETPSIAPDNSGLADTAKEAERARAKLKQLFDGAMKKVFDGLKAALKKVASILPIIGKHSDGTFKKGLMQILKYGFGIRSIYVLFRRLRKAVVESFKELQNSGAFYEETRSNVEALKNSLTLLKYQFGAAFEPIFNAVAPALKTLVNNLVSVMNTISAFIAKLMGRSSYSKAVLNAAAFADNTGKAAKAQKELNKQLQGFDELNNLTTNNHNPSSGSGGSSDDIPGAVYVEESVDSVLGDFWKELADKIQAGDWRGVGKAISDKLSDAMESIHWDDIYQKARNFGTGLANFLNGLINPRLFGNVGKTIAGALNTAFAFLNSFGKTFDWKNFGISIAEGINQFFRTFDFKQAGEAFHAWIAGALDACIAFFDTVDFEEIGKAIADFIGGLNIPDLVSKLGQLALKIIEALAEAIKGLWNNSSVTGKLAMALIGLFGVLKLTGLTKTFAGLIGAALKGQTITVAASGTTISLVGSNVLIGGAAMAAGVGGMALGGSYFNSVDIVNKTPEENILNTLLGVGWGSASISALAAGMAKVAGTGTLFGTFASLLPGVAGATAAWTAGAYGGNRLGKTLASDEETKKYYDQYFGAFTPFEWKKTSQVFKDIYTAAKEGNLVPGIKMLGNAMYESIRNMGSKGVLSKSDLGGIDFSNFSSHIRDAENSFNSMGDSAQRLVEKTAALTNGAKQFGVEVESSNNKFRTGISNFTTSVVDSFTDAYNKGTRTWNGLGSWAKNKAADAGKGFNTFSSTTSKEFDNAYKQSTSKWSEISEWASGITDRTATGMNKLPSDVSGIFGDAYTKGTNQWNGIQPWARNMSNTVDTAFQTFPQSSSKQFDDAFKQSTEKWNGTKAWASKAFDQISASADTSLSRTVTTFQTKFQQGTMKAESQVSTFKSWLDRQELIKTAGVKPDESAFKSMNTKINGVTSSLTKIKNNTVNVAGSGFEALGTKITNLKNQISSLKSAGSSVNIGSSVSLRLFASGGVVGGATPAIVGEAGPEAILPLNDGTLGKLANMIVGDMAVPTMPTTNTSIVSGYGASSSNASEISRQNELLAEQNQLLRQIAAKELTVSTKEVFDATRQESNNYYNRTGSSPFLF